MTKIISVLDGLSGGEKLRNNVETGKGIG
jgi:hypothetical protein